MAVYRMLLFLAVLTIHQLFTTSAFLVIPRHPAKYFKGNTCCKSTTNADNRIAARLTFRPPTSEDIPTIFDIESSSFPSDEAASLKSLEYRHANASPYFRCAILDDEIIGFVCSTKCEQFEKESMSTHDPDGKLLAIHSVVVRDDCRRQGVATTMLNHYVKYIEEEDQNDTIESFVLIAKAHLLGFYVNCGFRVNRPSPIVHGQELWYELEKKKMKTVRSLPLASESWFCKTEQFKRPFPEVKPHLEAHKKWVEDLRREGNCITSGYRVDSKGRPGGGGLMFLAAESYDDAYETVLQDPLVANDCVDWELNGWIGQVGDVQMR